MRSLFIGDTIVFNRIRFVVQARDDRFIICTGRNKALKFFYTIIDLERGIRGPDNLVFSFDYDTKEKCEDRLKELQSGELEFIRRDGRYVLLDEKII